MERTLWSMGAGILALGLILAVAPQSQEDEKDPLREKIVKLLTVQNGGAPVWKKTTEGFAMNLGGMPESVIAKIFTDEDREEITDIYVAAYRKHYTEADIDQLLAFYETPLGRKFSRAQPGIEKDTAKSVQTWSMKMVPRLMKAMQEWMKSDDFEPTGDGPLSGVGEAKRIGNETSAIGALRTISSVQAQFREGDRDNDNILDYATSLAELFEAGLIEEKLGSGEKSGYRFGLSGSTFDWLATATPVSEKSGSMNFIICTDGVVRFTRSGKATCSSAAIQ